MPLIRINQMMLFIFGVQNLEIENYAKNNQIKITRSRWFHKIGKFRFRFNQTFSLIFDDLGIY